MKPPIVTFLVLTLVCAAACSDPIEFADWTIPVPEGTRIIEYAAVPAGDRSQRLGLERDLVISEGLGRPLYRPTSVALGAGGEIFVVDAGNHRIVVFDQNGTALREFGREGQGPGEFLDPVVLAVTNDTVVVQDVLNRRFSFFDTAGNLLRELGLEDRIWARETRLLDDRLLIFDAPRLPVSFFGTEPPSVRAVIGLYSLAGVEATALLELTATLQSFWNSGSVGGVVPMACAYPQAAIGPDATVYATGGDEYQVVAVRTSGETIWAVRVDGSAEVPTQEHKDEVVARFRGDWPEIREQDFKWPDRYAAIENLEVDGHGNLYVIPYTYRPGSRALDMYRPQGSVEPPTRPVPVDVYSPEGNRLFSGLASIDSWNAAGGDHVYRIEIDPLSGEQVVARYRLIEPFE